MNKRRILVKRNGAETKIYFANWAHHVKYDAVASYMKMASYNNNCLGGSLTDLGKGLITIEFNPLVHKRSTRRKVEKDLKKIVESYT